MPNNSPAVSVIVPVYNTEKYLRRCLDSILAQTFTDWECLVIDDGSTDTSPAICDEYAAADTRFRVFHKANGGFCSARNVGLNVSHGRWIIFADSDDYYTSEEAFALMYEKASYESADVVLFDFLMESQNKTSRYNLPQWEEDYKTESLRKYISFPWTTAWTIFANKKTLQENNIKFEEDLTFCEDFLYGLKLTYSAKRVVHLSRALYCYNRMNESSCLHNITQKKILSEQKAYLLAVDFLNQEGSLLDYEKEISWRILKSTQEMLLDKSQHHDFVTFFPKIKDYILSCPFLNKKQKIMAYCLTHQNGWATRAIVDVRKLLKR